VALTVLYVPSSLGAGHHASDMTLRFSASFGDSETHVRRRNHLKGVLPESQGQNLALTVLYVPYSLSAGHHGGDMPVRFAASCGDAETQVRRGDHLKGSKGLPESQVQNMAVNHSKGSQGFCMKFKAIMWPELFLVCAISARRGVPHG
jgi:hypothetical protein